MMKSKTFRVCALAVIGVAASDGAAQAMCGKASWYHEGSRTANGERYRPDGISAAHKTLPFGTRVLVRNQHTGRTVTVRINDRGPFIRGRIIDLSRGAKRILGMDGIASVCLTVLGRGPSYAEADTGDAGVRRVSRRNQRVVREVYRTAQTSAQWGGDDEDESRPVAKRRSRHATRSHNRAVAQRRRDREGGEYQEARADESGSSFKLANWPQTSDGRF